MTLLHQILAVERGARNQAQRGLTEAYHLIQRSNTLSGLRKVYRPADVDGEELPPESTKVQTTVVEVIDQVMESLAPMFDLVAVRDKTTALTKANVVVGGQTLIADVPVPYLLWLEKQLQDLETFIRKMPVLDPAEDWHPDPTREGVWATEPVISYRSKKLPRPVELAPATDKHPAQVQLAHEDVVQGKWELTKFSGAVQARTQQEMLRRVRILATAVKQAREQANSIETVDEEPIGAAVLGYVFQQ